MPARTGTQTVEPRACTVDYASPEQIPGHASSTSYDVYTLGTALCELSSLPLDEAGRQVQTNDLARTGTQTIMLRYSLGFRKPMGLGWYGAGSATLPFADIFFSSPSAQ